MSFMWNHCSKLNIWVLDKMDYFHGLLFAIFMVISWSLLLELLIFSWRKTESHDILDNHHPLQTLFHLKNFVSSDINCKLMDRSGWDRSGIVGQIRLYGDEPSLPAKVPTIFDEKSMMRKTSRCHGETLLLFNLPLLSVTLWFLHPVSHSS